MPKLSFFCKAMLLFVLFSSSAVCLTETASYGLATVYSQAQVDWSKFEIKSSYSMTYNINWKWDEPWGRAEHLGSVDESYWETQGRPNWNGTSYTAKKEGVGDNRATALACTGTGSKPVCGSNGEILFSSADASSDLGGPYSSWSRAWRIGEFTVTGTGTLTITVPYSFLISMSTDRNIEYVYGDTDAMLELSKYQPDSDSWLNIVTVTPDNKLGQQFYGISHPPVKEASGTLSTDLDCTTTGGCTGDFRFRVGTYSGGFANHLPIPEPSTLLLFAVGLLGLFKLRHVK